MTITTYLLAVFLTATTSGLTDDAQSHPPQQEVLPAQAQVQAQNQTIIQARADLENAANQAGIDNKRLGTRLDELEARKTLNQLTDTQIVFAYQKLTELLTSTQNGPHFDIAQRKALVELVCHNLARPSSIDQGNHPTCNVTTLEVYLAARHPDIYADTIKQIVLTGKYTNWNNETITPPKTALMPGDDEKAYDMDIPPNNKRNHASQIMQMTLVNGLYETGRLHEQKDSKGNKIDTTGWRYIMVAPVKIYSYFGGYYGYTTEEDRLLDDKGVAQKGKDGKASTNPNVIGGDILSASEMMLGYKMPYLNAPY
ncbi:MAG: hypothetical protein K8F91_18220, partial [Candidatus Obscuribacterales bacterium]|nr:hypothetical protein [Candidatus Obscuribacterales bacterium]